ncbi:MAG: hypothetical protein KBT32_02180 [Bacteroidales bacterium]|nr:hypothetical protein [Candidatus Physcocola equi]
MKFEDYYYGTSSQNRLFGWSVENRNINFNKIDDEHFTITIPADYNTGKYTLYYGKNKYTWFLFYTVYYGTSSFDIKVCQDDPYIEVDKKCVCPGDEIRLTIEQSDESTHVWKYRTDDNSKWTTVTNYTAVDNKTIIFETPNNFNSRIYFQADGRAEADISVCLPVLIGPQCAPKSTSVKFQIEQACPNITYVFDGINCNGNTSYEITRPYNNNSKTYELKVKQGNETVQIDEWKVATCPITINCPNNYNSFPKQFKANRFDCGILASEIVNTLRNYNLLPTQSGGTNIQLYYWYKENGNNDEKKIDDNTVLKAGSKYTLRIEVYVDNNFMGICEGPEVQIISDYKVIANAYYGGSATVTQNGVDKNNQTVDCGSEILLTAIPNACFRFKQWNDGNTENPRMIVVDRNLNLEANFEQIKPTVIAVSNDNNFGTVSIKKWNGDFTSGSQVNNCGDRLIITATPKNSCYELEKWSDETTELVKTIDVRTDVNLTAIFRQKDVHITASSNDESLGTVAISGTNSCGNTVTITATPKACSDFVQWNDGNTNKERTVEVTENQNFVATFTNASNFTLTCKDYSFLREDAGSGNATVTFPLPEVSVGTVDSYSWSVSSGLSKSGSNVTGTLPFGENSVTITAAKCGHSESCTTTVKLLKSVPPCE